MPSTVLAFKIVGHEEATHKYLLDWLEWDLLGSVVASRKAELLRCVSQTLQNMDEHENNGFWPYDWPDTALGVKRAREGERGPSPPLHNIDKDERTKSVASLSGTCQALQPLPSSTHG